MNYDENIFYTFIYDDMWCMITHVFYDVWCGISYVFYDVECESAYIYIMICGLKVHVYIMIMCSVRVYIYVMIWVIEFHEFGMFSSYAYNYFDIEFYHFILHILRLYLLKK